MNKIVFIVYSFFTLACFSEQAFGVEKVPPHIWSDDISISVLGLSFPVGEITVRVVDENNQVVTNAEVIVRGMYTPEGRDLGDVKKKTDEKGEACFVSPMGNGFRIIVTHESFYKSEKGGRFEKEVEKKWVPKNPVLTIKLRKIENPIPVYKKQTEWLNLPDEDVGYDLLKGGFVAPYGQGEIADFLISFSFETEGDFIKREPESWARQRFAFTFSGAFNGVEVFEDDKDAVDSCFKDPRYAFAEGYEINQVVRQTGSMISIPSRETNWEPWIRGFDKIRTPESDFVFFRIRSECNPDGSFKSALYGKMKIPTFTGFDVRRKPRRISGIEYWLNPTRNDRNMEFDESKNLFDPKWQKTEGAK